MQLLRFLWQHTVIVLCTKTHYVTPNQLTWHQSGVRCYFFYPCAQYIQKNTLKTKKQLVKSISPPRWQKYCLFPNYPCSWFIQYIYIYPIACIWHMAYGLTTTNHYCWKTTTILNYVTSYHIILHYSIFYRTKLLYSIWQYKWYNYIYTYILSHYILSYQIIFFYIFHPFVDYIHPYEASIPAIHRDLFPRSAHSPGFRKRRPRWCRWVRKSSPLPTATAPGKTMVARKKAG